VLAVQISDSERFEPASSRCDSQVAATDGLHSQVLALVDDLLGFSLCLVETDALISAAVRVTVREECEWKGSLTVWSEEPERQSDRWLTVQATAESRIAVQIFCSKDFDGWCVSRECLLHGAQPEE
jgi:hypothetical protein